MMYLLVLLQALVFSSPIPCPVAALFQGEGPTLRKISEIKAAHSEMDISLISHDEWVVVTIYEKPQVEPGRVLVSLYNTRLNLWQGSIQVPWSKPPTLAAIRVPKRIIYETVGTTVETVFSQSLDHQTEKKIVEVRTIVGGKEVAKEELLLTAHGVFRTKVNNTSILPAFQFVNPELPLGASYIAKSEVAGARVIMEMIHTKSEAIEISGRKMTVRRIEGGGMIAGTPVYLTQWFGDLCVPLKVAYTVSGVTTELVAKELYF